MKGIKIIVVILAALVDAYLIYLFIEDVNNITVTTDNKSLDE